MLRSSNPAGGGLPRSVDVTGQAGGPAPVGDGTLKEALQAAAGPGGWGAGDTTLAAALDSYLQSKDSSGALDLSEVAPSALRLLTPQVAQALVRTAGEKGAGPIERVHLPSGLTTLPEGLGALPALKQLEIPEFAGSVMDIRVLDRDTRDRKAGPVEILARGAPALETIQAWKGQPTGAVWPAHLRKVQVLRHEPGGSDARRETLPGIAYFPLGSAKKLSGQGRDDAHAQALTTQLNGAARFSDDGKQIVCRHLSLAYVTARIEHLASRDKGARKTGFDLDNFASAEKIARTVTPRSRAVVDRVLDHPEGNHLVALSSWGPFLASQFTRMRAGDHRHLLLMSENHVMALELGVKRPAEEGLPDPCVIRFYDPTQTTADQRLVLPRPQIAQCSLGNFLEPERLQHYFEAPDDEAVARVLVIDESLLRDTGPQARNTPAGIRARSAGLEFAGDPLSAGCLALAFRSRFTEGLTDRLRTAVQDRKPLAAPAEALFSDPRFDPLGAHLIDGDARSVEALMILASQVPDKADRVELLQAPRHDREWQEGRPPREARLQGAMGLGNTETAAAFIQGLLAPEMKFTRAESAAILGVRRRSSSSPASGCLTEAMAAGRTDAVRLFLRTLADGRLGLDGAARLEVLEQRQDDRNCSLLEALEHGHEEAARTYVSEIARPAFGLSTDQRAGFYRNMATEAASIDGVTWPPTWLAEVDPAGAARAQG